MCAYTSSAMNVCNNESADRIVGLELMGENTKMDDRKILAQVVTPLYRYYSIYMIIVKLLRHTNQQTFFDTFK